jgi:hypothetical protein
MAITKVHSDLPAPAKTVEHGRNPDPAPTFLQPYLDHLAEKAAADGDRPHAVAGTRFRHSMAGACSRQVAFHALGVQSSNPMDLAGMVVTGNGTAKHDEIQTILMGRLGPALQIEVPCQVPGLDGSGSADGVFLQNRADDVAYERVCWEHKNVGGFAFKMAIGERGAAQGPKWAHIVQAALNAKAQDADLVVITYMTWEAVSVNLAKKKGLTEAGRVAAQWTFTREEWEPLADAEIARVSRILALLDEGVLPGRSFPDPELPVGNIVSHPPTGGWEHKDADGQILDAGTFWACGYCRWQDVCAQTKPGRQPISEVAVTLGLSSGEAA